MTMRDNVIKQLDREAAYAVVASKSADYYTLYVQRDGSLQWDVSATPSLMPVPFLATGLQGHASWTKQQWVLSMLDWLDCIPYGYFKDELP